MNRIRKTIIVAIATLCCILGMSDKAVAAGNICCICEVEGGSTAPDSEKYDDVMTRPFLFEGLNYNCINTDVIENCVGYASGGESGCIITPPCEWISDLDTRLFIQFESLYSESYVMCIVKRPDTIIEYMDMQFARMDIIGNDITWRVPEGICYLDGYTLYFLPKNN